MADDKIRISWQDVNSAEVDARLRQQEALARTQQHVSEWSAPQTTPVAAAGSLWYNTIFYMALFGLVGGGLAWAIGELFELVSPDRSDQYLFILIFSSIYFALVGVTMAFFLGIADDAVSRNARGVVVSGSVAVALGLVGGAAGGLFGQLLYTLLGSVGESILLQIFARTCGWALVGAFLALAPGIVLRSWKRLGIGLLGGFLGGLLGGLLFDPIGMVVQSDEASRFVGLVGIGLLAGLGTGLIENAAKTGWLRVTAGLIAGKQFVVYKNPTTIGSSPQCEVYLFKDRLVAPRHAAIHRVSGGYDLEDLGSTTGTRVNGQPVTRRRLRHGDQIQIGGTVFLFQERERALR